MESGCYSGQMLAGGAAPIVELREVAPGLAVTAHGLVDELTPQQTGIGLARHDLGIETI